MDDTIHVQVQVVRLLAIGVGFGRIDGNHFAIDFIWLLLDDRRDDFWVFVGEPTEQSRNTHDVYFQWTVILFLRFEMFNVRGPFIVDGAK